MEAPKSVSAAVRVSAGASRRSTSYVFVNSLRWEAGETGRLLNWGYEGRGPEQMMCGIVCRNVWWREKSRCRLHRRG